jgi:fructose-1,6-bisphosphatase/inositol monophosphatase family enzyme
VIGLPTWATLIALYADGQPVLGVMSQPFVGDTFYGNREGSWLDHRGKRSANQGRAAPRASPIAWPEPHRPTSTKEDSAVSFRTPARTSVKSMRYGLDCYSFSLMAAGHLDIAMDPVLQIYDIAALIPIIQGAGGVVASWTDNDPRAKAAM